jgi:hypothetical protein
VRVTPAWITVPLMISRFEFTGAERDSGARFVFCLGDLEEYLPAARTWLSQSLRSFHTLRTPREMESQYCKLVIVVLESCA